MQRTARFARGFGLLCLAASSVLSSLPVQAQCPAAEVVAGLRRPLGIIQSNQGNLLVAEAGDGVPGAVVLSSGRISIVDRDGNRRTLLDGLPSGPNDADGLPAGPSGLFMRGRTLFLVTAAGDSLLGPGNTSPPVVGPVPNPNPSSPLFSSVLAIHFSAKVEKTTAGFTLTAADHQAIAAGTKVTLRNGAGDTLAIELVADFPNATVDPTSPSGFRNTNPFALVAVGNQLYVTDGGQNLIWQVDIATGAISVLTTFPRIANPAFGVIGGPFLDAVPTAIHYADGQLLVTLFRGFPFPAGASEVRSVDPATGTQASFIGGLKTAIDVLPIRSRGDTDHLVLQHASSPLFPILGQPGLLLRFETTSSAPAVVANCLTRPTAMTLDEKTGTLYVTEVGGRVVALSIDP